MKIDKSYWFSEFYFSLSDQHRDLLNSGTDYRIETSRLSLEIVKKEKNIDLFLELDHALRVVSRHFPDLDEERLHDVSKMLHVNARKVENINTRNEEAKNYVKEKMKNRKLIRLTKTKKE